MSGPRVLVCGGRDFNFPELVFYELDRLRPSVVLHGGARGADASAAEWAAATRTPELRFSADWDQYGRRAGPLRNRLMLREGKPDLVLAFPGGAGTADMVRSAEAAYVPVLRVGW